MKEHSAMLEDLKKLDIKEGGYLLVHSSYKSLGPSINGIQQVIATLKAAIGTEGTLLFPALSYQYVNADSPYFDIKNTPSCIGSIPEWFRKQPGVFRSMSPTHSVSAIGPGAKAITTGHELDDTPVGPNSPFRRLRDLGGKILMLGCGLTPNTSMHGVEELAPPPYLFRETITYTCIDRDGTASKIPARRHNFGDSVVQRYDRLKYILPENVLKTGPVLDANCYLIEAKPMWDIAEAVLREDPLFFVDGPVFCQ